MTIAVVPALALSLIVAGTASSSGPQALPRVTVTAAQETAPVPHSGDAADDPAIWLHPTRPARSTIIGTDKRGGLGVYDLAGRQLHYYADSRPNNVDLRYGFPLAGRRITVVATSDSEADTIRLYRVNPTTRGLEAIGRPIPVGIGIAGLCVYRSGSSGTYVFVTDNSGTVQQWKLIGDGGGTVGARKVRTLQLGSTAEGCVADDDLGRLYVAEEEVAIWRYGAEPNAGTNRARVDAAGSGRLVADIEGLAIAYEGRKEGYLIASSQGSDSFAVYERGGPNRYLMSFSVGPGRIDGVTHTDGIDVTSRGLGTAFPKGVFVAQDDNDESGRQNFKLVRWDRIAPRAAAALATRIPATVRTTAQRSAPAARRFYLDSSDGDDARSGTSRATAWRTLKRASAAALAPGDKLLLRRGGEWPATLTIAASGTSSRGIVVDAYGKGPLPVVEGGSSCVVLAGSHVTVRHLHVRDCSWAGVDVHGSANRIERSLVRGNAVGIYVRRSAAGTRILRNRIVDNNKMAVLTAAAGNDDSGAFGILLHGDRTEVAYNTIRGSDAFSYDYGRDGAAIEIYGGRENRIHHNLAFDNDAFAELGHARSADNTFAYNVVRSKLPGSVFVVTRGAGSRYGPVQQTRLDHNTVYLTGESSQGVVCHDGCGLNILTMRNNIVYAGWKAGYADAPFDEDYDLFWGGPVQFATGQHSLVADPAFVRAPAGDLRLRRSSPAIDRAVDLGYKRDFANRSARADGDGDGRSTPDLGAFELQPRR
ncbi:MAG: phytase [Gaiellaceae bacterium]